MKFSCSVTINKPLDQTLKIWTNPDLLKEWQDGFIKLEMLEGVPEQVGSKTKIYYKQGKGQMEITETILRFDLPREMKGLYEHKSMSNTMHNTFHVISDQQCRWDAEIHYTKFTGFIPKMMGKFMPGMFKKQTQKWMDQFAEYVERSTV